MWNFTDIKLSGISPNILNERILFAEKTQFYLKLICYSSIYNNARDQSHKIEAHCSYDTMFGCKAIYDVHMVASGTELNWNIVMGKARKYLIYFINKVNPRNVI